MIEEIYYCKESRNNIRTNELNCIAKLIKNEPAVCDLLNGTEISTIYQPEPNFILCINIPTTTLNSTCGHTINEVKGTILIHFDNCSVELNHIVYDSKLTAYWDDIIIYPSMFNKIENSSVIENLSLQKLKNYHFQNRKAINLLETKTTHRDYLTFGPMTLIYIAAIIYIIIRFRKNIGFRSTGHIEISSRDQYSQ